jgi:acyl carrier protein
MNKKLKKIVSEILEIDIDSINDETSPQNVESWDSLKHIYIVTSIEEEFNIRFSDEEITDMLNYKLICMILEEKINQSI